MSIFCLNLRKPLSKWKKSSKTKRCFSMTIDAHSHYMPPEVAAKTAFFKEHWSDAEKQLRLMDGFHVDQALLVYPTSDAHINMGGWAPLAKIYNQAIGDLIKKYSRFIGGGILPVDKPE